MCPRQREWPGQWEHTNVRRVLEVEQVAKKALFWSLYQTFKIACGVKTDP